jgi:hypothetical protein
VGSEQIALHFALEETLKLLPEIFPFAAQTRHQREPLVNLLA